MKVRTVTELAGMVRERREFLGLTQAQLAERASVSRLWVGKLEKGRVAVTADLLFRALQVLGLAMDIAPCIARPRGADLDQIIADHSGEMEL